MLSHDPKENNELAVMILTDSEGHIIERLTVEEWLKRQTMDESREDYEIKLYREALNYYASADYNKAEDLLIYLCENCDYSRYEYIERLANLYRNQDRIDKERMVLLMARRNTTMPALLERIDRRLTLLDKKIIIKQRQVNLQLG